MNHLLETPSTVRARSAALADAAREYYTARTGGARHRAFQRMQAMNKPIERRTAEEFTYTIHSRTVTVPSGTLVRQTTPAQCPTGPLWYVVDHSVIPERANDAILRHDLEHYFVFVPASILA